MKNILIPIVDYFHLYVAIYPFLVNVMPLTISNFNTLYYYHHKIMILLCILVPSHWGLLDDRCIITIISEKLGDTTINNNSSSRIQIKLIEGDDNDNDNDNENENNNDDEKKKFIDENSPFIEKYARPVYEKMLNIFGLKWNAKTSQKLIYGYWFVNHIILWNYLYNNLAYMQSAL